MELEPEKLNISPMQKTWILDLDGTLALLIGGVISCSIHLIMKDKDSDRKDREEDKKEQS